MTTSCIMRRRLVEAWLVTLLVLGSVAVAGASHTIILQSDPPQAGTLFGAGRYESGERVQVTALPARGFEFWGWFDDGAEVSRSPSLEFIAGSDRTLVARFLASLDFVGITGSGGGTLTLLPAVALGANRFEIRPRFRFGASPWDLRLVTAFMGEEWRDAQVHFTGSWNTMRFGGGLMFSPAVPAYRSAYFMASGAWQDLRLGLRVTHYPSSGSPPAPYLLYVLTLSRPGLSVTLRGEDREALAFKDALVSVLGLSLCCGIEVQGTLSFTKDGLSYVRAALAGLPFPCCGLSFDAAVTFTADSKAVEFAPRWNAFCDACLTVYGDVVWDRDAFRWDGFALYGYKIRCCFGSPCCPAGSGWYVEILTAFEPGRVPGGFQGEEFQYVRVETCGPACCGGRYSFEATAYFSPTGLFGLSRFRVGGNIPLSGGWEVSPALEITGNSTSLNLGWRLRF